MKYCAEYHEHVRVIHLSIDISSEPDDLTSLEIYDRKTLRLRHAFQSHTIALPASVKLSEKLNIVIDKTIISCRIPASSILEAAGTLDVPLSSSDELGNDLICQACSTRIVAASSLVWKNLPSEHWVEMMDSWHCHRGVTDEHHHEHHDQYALPEHIVSATERIRARPGIGLVGLSYLLIHPQDFQGCKAQDGAVTCAKCDTLLGSLDGSEHRFHKARVAAKGQRSPEPLTYVIIGMLSTLEAHAVHHFLIKSTSPESGMIIVWILTPDARMTGTEISTKTPGQRVIKVMFRRGIVDDLQNDELEQMEVDQVDFSRLENALRLGHTILGSLRSKEWKSSFLRRYEHSLADVN